VQIKAWYGRFIQPTINQPIRKKRVGYSKASTHPTLATLAIADRYSMVRWFVLKKIVLILSRFQTSRAQNIPTKSINIRRD